MSATRCHEIQQMVVVSAAWVIIIRISKSLLLLEKIQMPIWIRTITNKLSKNNKWYSLALFSNSNKSIIKKWFWLLVAKCKGIQLVSMVQIKITKMEERTKIILVKIRSKIKIITMLVEVILIPIGHTPMLLWQTQSIYKDISNNIKVSLCLQVVINTKISCQVQHNRIFTKLSIMHLQEIQTIKLEVKIISKYLSYCPHRHRIIQGKDPHKYTTI